jgi:hypothetical protein
MMEPLFVLTVISVIFLLLGGAPERTPLGVARLILGVVLLVLLVLRWAGQV